jgi:predicted lipid-binding transport protein (Tim44 family)
MQDAQSKSREKRIDAFLKFAETSFLLMQRLWDAGDMAEISKLVSTRLLNQLEKDLVARGARTNFTEVTQLNFKLTSDFNDEVGSTVSVKFWGEMREEIDEAAERFEDIWHFCRINDGEKAWRIDGIRIVA